MQHTLFDNPFNRKRRPSENAYKNTRKVGGNAWQARVWMGREMGSLNLGLFTVRKWGTEKAAEWAAARAAREFDKFYNPTNPTRDLKATLTHLKARNLIPEGVLPPRVKPVEGGYTATAKVGGQRVDIGRVCKDPWAAYDLLRAAVANLRPGTHPESPAPVRVKPRPPRYTTDLCGFYQVA